MQDFRGKHEGDLILSSDTDVHGMIDGSLIIPSGMLLVLHGMVTGNGEVRNEGAHVEIFGMVGAVRDLGTTESKISAKAIITGSK